MRRDQRGSVAIEFLVMMGVLILPFSCFLVATAWPEAMNAAKAAAYEAAKAVVTAPDPAAGEDLGRQRAGEVMTNHGFAGPVDVTFTQAGRGEAMTATVTIELPALRFPGVGSWDAISWSRSHTERVPDYRGFS
jgi:ribosomal protein L35AE/L33A